MVKVKKERDRYLFGGMLGYNVALLFFVLSNFDGLGCTLLLCLLSIIIPCLAVGLIKVHNDAEETNDIEENIIGMGLIGTFLATLGLIFLFSKIAALIMFLSTGAIAFTMAMFSNK